MNVNNIFYICTNYIKSIITYKSSHPHIWLVLFAFLVAILQNYIGIRISIDSNWYLLNASTMENFEFNRIAQYAPLYSWSLGFLNLLGFTTQGSIFLYWWLCYLLLLLIFYLPTKNLLIALLALIVVISNPNTATYYRYILTELGYSVILLLSIYSLYTWRETDNKQYQYIFLISIALLPLQRYIGGYLSIYLGLIYLFTQKNAILLRAMNLALSAIPLTLIVIWNIILSGHVSGDRSVTKISYLENIVRTKDVILNNFFSEWILLCIGIILIIYFQYKNKKIHIIFFLAMVPLIQLFAQIHSSSTYVFDAISPRFFIILTPSILMLLILFTNILMKKKGILIIFFILLSIILGNQYFNVEKLSLTKDDYSILIDQKAKDILSNLDTAQTIGILRTNAQWLNTQTVLMGNIIPKTHCQEYIAKSANNFQRIIFIPECKTLNGHTYTTISYTSSNIPNYIFLNIFRLQKNWATYFTDYSSFATGSNIFLYKKEDMIAIEAIYSSEKIDYIKLYNFSTDFKYYVDKFINDKFGITIYGWGFTNINRKDKTKKFIMLKGKNKNFIFTSNKITRSDVTYHFKAKNNYLNNSGFVTMLSKSHLEKGEYEVYLLLIDEDNKQYLSLIKKLLKIE